MNIEGMIARLENCNIKAVSRKTGVHYNTLYKIKKGDVSSIKVGTINKLIDFFSEVEK